MPNGPSQGGGFVQLILQNELALEMKKLKWSRVGNTGGNAMDVFPGQLLNYCLACPQSSINVPEDWKDDSNR